MNIRHGLFACGFLALAASTAFAADALPPGNSPDASGAATAVTFSKDIAPIVFSNCVSCHRPGEVAPFSLTDYASVRKHAKEIGDLTQSRTMPPWKPEDHFGDFEGVRRLSDSQIDLIQRWIKAGKPEGNPADLPEAPKFPGGWTLGEPDLVVKMPKAYTLRAQGTDDYRCFVIPLNLDQTRFVTGVEFHAGNPKIVHHALFFLDTNGNGRQLEAASKDGGAGYFGAGGPGFMPTGSLGGWAPGVMPERLPDGIGRVVKAGSDLVIQIHFHPSGKVEQEQSELAIYFAKKPVDKIFVSYPHGENHIDIQPGDNHYVINNSFTVPTDVQMLGIFPHAHLLCRDIKVTATLPTGESVPLIWIKDWDWNWQGQYLYKQPISIPKGTKITQEFTYDNSPANIHNPNTPPKEIRHGEQTGDEMSLVFYQLIVDRSNALVRLQELLGNRRGALQRQNQVETKSTNTQDHPADKHE
jgi:mono/diheme cytochrome c family protein